MNFLLSPFNNIDVNIFQKNREICRVLLGALLMYKFLQMQGFSILVPNPVDYYNYFFQGVLLSALLILGVFTPGVLFVLGYHYFIFGRYHGSLFIPVGILLVWGLFFSGAGKKWSIDSVFLKNKHIRKFYSYLYIFSFPLNKKNISLLFMGLLFSFWGICLNAMFFHFKDPLWLKGNAIQALFLSPYLSDFYHIFEKWHKYSPWSFDRLLTVCLFLQGIWELFLIPLTYRFWGKVFVIFFGLGFFIMSLSFLNLSYLAWVEVILWGFLFHFPLRKYEVEIFYDHRCGLCKKTIKVLKFFDIFNRIKPLPYIEGGEEVKKLVEEENQIVLKEGTRLFKGFETYYSLSRKVYPFVIVFPVMYLFKVSSLGDKLYKFIAKKRKKIFGVCTPYRYVPLDNLPQKAKSFSWIFYGFIVLIISVTTFFATVNFVRFVFGQKKPSFMLTRKATRFFIAFGHRDVNVFNGPDLLMSEYSLLIYEKKAEGIKLVPFMDYMSGRLDYLRSDYFYFARSLRWQRAHVSRKFDSIESFSPSRYTYDLINSVVALDYCLNGYSEEKKYYTHILRKKRIRAEYGYFVWSHPEVVKKLYTIASKKSLHKLEKKGCDKAFFFGHGHSQTEVREQKTLDFIKSIDDSNSSFHEFLLRER